MERLVKCDICAVEFTASSPNKKRCSPKCVLAYRNNWMKSHRVYCGPTKIMECRDCKTPNVFSSKTKPSNALCSGCKAIARKDTISKFKITNKYKEGQKRFAAKTETIAYRAKWRRENAKKLADRIKERKQQDPAIKLAYSLRARLSPFIRGVRKADKTMNYVGLTKHGLKAHLEYLFKPGMSWDNYGKLGWHIDHIFPMSSFGFINYDGSVNEGEIKKAMHYTNLQPLWYWENISKSDKIPESTPTLNLI